MATEAEVLGQPRPFSDGSGGSGPCPLWWDGSGAGVPWFTTAVPSPLYLPQVQRPAPPGCPRGPSALLGAPLPTSSQIGVPDCWGCGSLCLRPGNQYFLEYSFPRRGNPVDFPELHSYLVLACKADGYATVFGLQISRWLACGSGELILKLRAHAEALGRFYPAEELSGLGSRHTRGSSGSSVARSGAARAARRSPGRRVSGGWVGKSAVRFSVNREASLLPSFCHIKILKVHELLSLPTPLCSFTAESDAFKSPSGNRILCLCENFELSEWPPDVCFKGEEEWYHKYETISPQSSNVLNTVQFLDTNVFGVPTEWRRFLEFCTVCFKGRRT